MVANPIMETDIPAETTEAKRQDTISRKQIMVIKDASDPQAKPDDARQPYPN